MKLFFLCFFLLMATEIVTKNLLNVLKNVAELGAQYAIDVRLVAVSKVNF